MIRRRFLAQSAAPGAGMLAGALLVAVAFITAAAAGEADVVAVEFSCNDNRICRFNVTVAHADDGWEHYANKWEVLTPEGELLGTRELLHPHVDEQPFTRSLSVSIPQGFSAVVVRAHDLVHGYGGAEMTVQLDQ